MKIGAKTYPNPSLKGGAFKSRCRAKLGEREKTYPNPSLKGGAFKPGRRRLPL